MYDLPNKRQTLGLDAGMTFELSTIVSYRGNIYSNNYLVHNITLHRRTKIETIHVPCGEAQKLHLTSGVV